MIKHNEVTLKKWEYHYKQFVAYITLNRGAMCWSFSIEDKSNIEIERGVNMHYMSDTDIENRIKTTIDDCIHNPAEFYN